MSSLLLTLYFITFKDYKWFYLGNYSSTSVDLGGNFLSRFEEGVFKYMLQDMTIGGEYVSVGPSSSGSSMHTCLFF